MKFHRWKTGWLFLAGRLKVEKSTKMRLNHPHFDRIHQLCFSWGIHCRP